MSASIRRYGVLVFVVAVFTFLPLKSIQALEVSVGFSICGGGGYSFVDGGFELGIGFNSNVMIGIQFGFPPFFNVGAFEKIQWRSFYFKNITNLNAFMINPFGFQYSTNTLIGGIRFVSTKGTDELPSYSLNPWLDDSQVFSELFLGAGIEIWRFEFFPGYSMLFQKTPINVESGARGYGKSF